MEPGNSACLISEHLSAACMSLNRQNENEKYGCFILLNNDSHEKYFGKV